MGGRFSSILTMTVGWICLLPMVTLTTISPRLTLLVRMPNRINFFLIIGVSVFRKSLISAIATQKVSRGAAFGDIDNDGDIDIVVSNLKDSPTILRNDGGNAAHWLGVKLIGTHCNRDAIGARVTVVSGGLTQIREVKKRFRLPQSKRSPSTFWIECRNAN